MDRMTRDIYSTLYLEWAAEVSPRLVLWSRRLDRVAGAISGVPFVVASAVIFLVCTAQYLGSGMQLATQAAASDIMMCGWGCILAVFGLFFNGSALTRAQALLCIAGNAYLMTMLQHA